ncbi:FliH/SctL family protein [Butyrivibrio sp. VCD2006]|uniref:FliH/SctL family protein n=1 Tax=Butyrivibrio sp. VCD2006 TaxID=1280664 RepID=UPI0009DC3A82|nr:FliH/SctL family protein [Butyrivibrio sp. VCD2006]
MTWLSNQSNLLKFGWYQVDENDKHIIDNNELAEKKIEKYQAEEAKRREALEKGEPVPAFSGFEEGLGFEQIGSYDDQNIIGNTNFGDPGELQEFSEDFQDEFLSNEGAANFGEAFDNIGEGFDENAGFPMEDHQGFAENEAYGIPDGAQDENLSGLYDENVAAEDSMGYQGEGFDQGMGVPEEDVNPDMDIPTSAEPPAQEVPQINLEEIQAQIDEQIRMAEEQAKQLVDDAQAQADEIRNQAMEEGRAAGYEEGIRQAAEEIEKMRADAEAEIEAEKQKQQSDFQQLVASIEPDMVDVLTQIYEHVFNVELRENKDIILHLIRTTLSKMDSGTDIILHISSDDYDLVSDEKSNLEEAMASPNSTLEIVEDPLLKENECIIESEGGVFDCSLGVELSELGRKLKLLSFDRSRR